MKVGADLQGKNNKTPTSMPSPGPSEPPATQAEIKTVDGPAAPSSPARRPNKGWFKKGRPGPRLAHGLYSDEHSDATAIVAAVEKFEAAQISTKASRQRPTSKLDADA